MTVGFREINLFAQKRVLGTLADAAGGEEEPVHEDPGAVVVGVEGQKPVPFVLLLAATVSITSGSTGL